MVPSPFGSLVHIARVLDLELRPLGIRVNAVAPQLLDTARNRTAGPAAPYDEG
jgi:NAD(P)-dependent dehydrogenase (short-subunit alcohol dehydrogenase family)